MNSKDFLKLKDFLSVPKQIVIVSHRNPDGDAYGSSLAMYHFLIKKGHQVNVVSPNDCPDFLKWLPGQEQIVIFDQETARASALIAAADVIFTLDFNALHRVGGAMEKDLLAFKGKYVMIDHHEQPNDYADFMFSDPSNSSTCQMIYHFFEHLDALKDMDDQIATCLYTGIVTDTGSFKYVATDSDTHIIASYLLNYNLKHATIHNRLFDANSFERMQLLGTALNNLKLLASYKTAYISLSQKELNAHNYKKGDTEGFVNYALSLKDVVFAVIFIEDQKQGIIKMSLRSKGDFSVNEFARAHFNGGGHNNAAGGRSELSLANTIDQFLKIIPTYQSILNESNENL